jgi:dihydroorotase
MTDKEFKKLNRLELLELLFSTINENQELKQKLDQLTDENEISKRMENLAIATKQASDILDYANKLVNIMQNDEKYEDWELYLKIMTFYMTNQAALEVFSPELRKQIVKRMEKL